MSLLRQLARGAHALLHPRQSHADVADEVSHYLAEATAALYELPTEAVEGLEFSELD